MLGAMSHDAQVRSETAAHGSEAASDDRSESTEAHETSTAVPQAARRGDRAVVLDDVRNHPEVVAFLRGADRHLRAIGYTEHGGRHAKLVAKIASNVLKRLEHAERDVELAGIAGLLHDIGNVVNREMHGQTGAILAKGILVDLGMPLEEIVRVMGAIGNHETTWGKATDPVAAALILADKADVHRSRVHGDADLSDIHDRVNYAATRSFLRVEPDAKTITLELEIDPEIASVMNYFEIFTDRMVFCRVASEYLGCDFALEVNGQRLS